MTEQPDTPDSIAVASLRTHRLILTVPNEGPVDIASNMSKTAVANVLRYVADQYAPVATPAALTGDEREFLAFAFALAADTREGAMPQAPAPAPDDSLSPTLRRLCDAIRAASALTPAEALADARELLADHARELVGLVQQRIEQDCADNPGGAYGKHRRGGMTSARQVLDRYADDLDAAGGES